MAWQFSDDLESGGFGAWLSTNVDAGGAIEVVAEAAYAGAFGCHALSGPGAGAQAQAIAALVPFATSRAFAQFRFRVLRAPAAGVSRVAYLRLVAIANIVELIVDNGVWQLRVRNRDGTTQTANLPAFTIGMWYTVELEYSWNGANPIARCYIEYILRATLTDLTAGAILVPDRFHIRAETTGAGDNAENHYDNCIVADVYIGEVNLMPPPVFQNGFEEGNFTAWTGTSVAGGGVVEVIAGAAYQGSFGARMAGGPAAGDEARCHQTFVFPASLIIACLFRFRPVVVNGAGRIEFCTLRQIAAPPSNTSALEYVVGNWQLRLTNRDGTVQTVNLPTISLSTWHIVQLVYDRSGANPVGRIFVDENPQVTLTDLTAGADRSPDQVRVRVSINDAGDNAETNVDNVILSNAILAMPTPSADIVRNDQEMPFFEPWSPALIIEALEGIGYKHTGYYDPFSRVVKLGERRNWGSVLRR